MKTKLRYLKLDTLFPRVVKIWDTLFTDARDHTSQIEWVAFPGVKSDNVDSPLYKSYKPRKVTRSAMRVEQVSFSKIFDTACTMSEELKF